ncbi:MAG: hypothetical protein C0183_07095 [Roseiflexus castenholzii]|nr:MAG: hypothetical protein C0183_07095 [Roseiflexus castenholzii]
MPGVTPVTIEDAAFVSFRALRFAQGKRSAESDRAQRGIGAGRARPLASLGVTTLYDLSRSDQIVEVVPDPSLTLADAAFGSFRALRFAQRGI